MVNSQKFYMSFAATYTSISTFSSFDERVFPEIHVNRMKVAPTGVTPNILGKTYKSVCGYIIRYKYGAKHKIQ